MKNFSVWSRRRLFLPRAGVGSGTLANQEPEPPKKVAAPQHCYQISNFSQRGQDPCCGSGMIYSESGSSLNFQNSVKHENLPISAISYFIKVPVHTFTIHTPITKITFNFSALSFFAGSLRIPDPRGSGPLVISVFDQTQIISNPGNELNKIRKVKKHST